MPQYYVLALFSPLGRLPQFPFAVLAVALAFAHIFVIGQMSWQGYADTWNGYTILLFVMLWMQFCVFSRRLRDTGNSGAILVPVFLVAMAVFVQRLDPASMYHDATSSDLYQLIGSRAEKLIRALYIAGFIYCIRAGGECGPNAYGPEFGDRSEIGVARPAFDDRRYSQEPVHDYAPLGQLAEAGWGTRRRPRDGFGKRFAG